MSYYTPLRAQGDSKLVKGQTKLEVKKKFRNMTDQNQIHFRKQPGTKNVILYFTSNFDLL